MQHPHSSGAGGGGKPPRRPPHKKELQLQGPRPSPLRVSKDSHKISKPPAHALLHHAPPPYPVAVASAPQHPDQRQPVIIYSISPKVIHAEENDFMSIVQRLTGLSPAPGDVSPAARLASIERTRPTERGATAGVSIGDEDFDLMELLEGVELGQIPGILSPAPATLPPVPTGMFSPVMEPQNMSFLQDLSPFWQGSFNSPSSNLLFSNTIFSPSPSPSVDLFNLFA